MLNFSPKKVAQSVRAPAREFTVRGAAAAKRRAIAFAAATAALAAIGVGNAASAATIAWTTNGNGNWSDPINWGGNPAPNAIDDVADFSTLDLAADATVTLDVGATVGSLIFGDTDGGVTTSAGWLIDGVNALTLATSGAGPTVTVNALGATEVARLNVTVSGTQGLTKSGVGTLVLTGSNNYTGGTTISAGTLQIGTGQAVAADVATLGAGPVTNNGTLTINKTNAITIADAIGGTGNLVKQGAANLTLSGANNYTGTTTVSGGLLTFGNAGAVSNLAAGSITVSGGGSIAYAAGAIAAPEFVTRIAGASTGALALGAGDSATNLDFTAGNLAPLGGMSVGTNTTLTYTGTVTPAGGVYRFGGGGGTLTLPNAIGGANSAVFGAGAGNTGTVILTADNTYSGTTTIAAGTLTLGAAGATGSIGAGDITNNGTLAINRSDAPVIANNITGTGNIQLTAGNPTFSGNITAGAVNASNTAGTHRVILSGPGSTYTFSALSTFNGGSGIFVNSGTANFNGGLRDDNADGGTLRVGDVTDGSTSTATAVLNVTDIHIQRNGGTANSTGDFTSGIQVGRGGTLNATTMRLGINNSNGALSIGIVGQPAGQGGTVNVSGALTLGEQSSGDRGGHMRVLDGGILNVPDTAQGLVIVRRTTGDAANQRSNATFAGNSVSTVGKIWFGFTADPVGLPITGGSSRLHMTGGNLYVGAGGMSWGGSGTHEATMNMTSGVYGAAANHIVDSGITFNLNAPVGTPFTIRAADAAGVAQNITLNNRLIGAGPLLKTGDGTLALYGPNTHTGPTTVSAGVLQGKGSSLRNAITNNATVRFDDAAGVSTFAGVISGPGAVDKIGLGTTVFNAGQTYTGATTISQGVLRFAGAHTTTSGVTVGNGGGLGATAGGATIPTLTLGSAGGDALTFSTNDGSGINALNVTNLNGLVANGLTTVELGSTGVTSGTFTLIDYNGAIGGGGFSPSTFTLGTLPPRTVASLANNVANTRIEVTVTNDGPRWNGTIDNKWDTNATQNWKGSFSDTDTNFLTGDGALFDHRATGSTDVSVVGTVLPSSTTVNNPVSKNYSIGGTGNIGGSGPLIKQGDGTLTLMTTGNTFTGGTQLQGGTLVLSNENALPAAGAVTVSGGTLDLGGAPQDITGNFVVNGGTVTFGAIEKEGSAFDVRSGAVTNSVSLRGPVGLTKTTPGTFILTGNSHTYTGATTVTEGTLQLGNGVNDGNVPGNINNSGTVTFNPATEGFAWNNQVNGLTAEVVKDGPRAMFFTNVNEGNATINGGMAILIGPGGTSVVPRLGRGGRITVNNGATVLLQGAQGMGLNTANLPPSFLLNAGGTIKTDVNAEASIYNGTFAGGILSAEPGFLSLAFRGDFTTTADSTSSIIVPGPIGLNNAVGFALGANSTITIQADLTGATSLGFTGAGTAILDGDNSGVTGGVSVGDGATVEVADANRLGTTGAVTLNSGTIKTLAAINATHEIRVTGGGTINTNGFDSTFSGPTSQDGPFTKAGAGTLTVSGATGHTGATNVTGGTLVIGQSLTTSSEVSTSGDGVLSVTSDGTYNKFVNTGALTIADNSKIDLSDNKLLTSTPVGNFDGTAYTGVQGMVQRAYNFGAWDQPGLMTSQERAGFNAGPLSGTTTIGVATAEQVLFIGPTDTAVFQGQTVTGATTIAMYTYAGDLNFDGLVDGADYGVIDNYVQFPGTDGYVNGDFNYDGIIDGADYGVIDNTIQLQGAQIPGVTFGAASASSAGGLSGVTAVPEPSACGFAILGAAALLGRRRRRRRCDAAQQ